MQLRAEYLLQAVSHCLSQIVAPAIENSNGVAQEQIAIAIGLLDFMAARLPDQFDFDCNELAGLIDLAEGLTRLGPQDGEAQNAIAQAKDVLARAKAGPSEIAATSRTMREGIRAAIDTLYARDGATRDALQKEVLTQGKRALTVERAWLSPLGFERGAQPLPPLETLLKSTAGAAESTDQ
jgi:hypothetical protein